MTQQELDRTLYELCSGDADAVGLIMGFWGFMEAWDDVVDRDKPHDDAAVTEAMMWALFGLHDNRFYQRFSAVLRGAIHQAIGSWLAANDFERTKQPELLEQAYFMRCSAYDVFALVVLLASGPVKHAQAIRYFRSLAPDDTLSSYLREHTGE